MAMKWMLVHRMVQMAAITGWMLVHRITITTRTARPLRIHLVQTAAITGWMSPHHYHNKNSTPTSYSFGANGGNHRMDVDPPHAHHSNTHQNKKLFQYRGTDSHNSSGENERTRSSDYCTDITHEQKTNHRDYTNDIDRKEWAEFLQYKRHRARAMAGQGHASGLSFERRRQMPLLQCQVPAFDERDGCDLVCHSLFEYMRIPVNI
eukprot:1030258_1